MADRDPETNATERERLVAAVFYEIRDEFHAQSAVGYSLSCRVADRLLAQGWGDVNGLLDRMAVEVNEAVRSGGTPTPIVAAAERGIAQRLTWPSMHWGTERVHVDAWVHIARAAAVGVIERMRASRG